MINDKFRQTVVYLGMASLGSGILFGEKKEPEKPVVQTGKDQVEIDQILAKIKSIKTEPTKVKKKKVKKIIEPKKKMTLIERIRFVLTG